MEKTTIALMDKQTLCAKETLFAIFEEPDEFDRQVMLNAMVDRAHDLGCVKPVQALIKAFKDELKKTMRGGDRDGMTEFGYPHADEMRCGSWIADRDGIRILTMVGEMVACYHPILPVERLRNTETGTEKIRLAFKRNNAWADIVVDKEVVANTSKIVALARHGVAVTSETAKWLVRFLSDVENMNDIPLRTSTSKLGWSGSDFLPYDQNVMFDSRTKFGDIAQAVGSCGSRDIWMETVRGIRKDGRMEVSLLMAASLASVLLKPLSLLPFVLNLSSQTGSGKTVALMVATSIWANPADHKYLVEVEATQVGFEVRLDVLNNLPLMIDDFSKIEDKFKDRFTDLIYMLTSGRGKDRATIDLGLNASKTWCNATIGAMEKPLTNDSMRGGAINRVLDIEAGEGRMFKDPNRLVETIKENYGFAGIDFVNAVKDIGVERLQDMRRAIEAEIKEIAERQGVEKEEKQILPLSAILLADRIMTDSIFGDGLYLDREALIRQLADIDATSDYRRAYEYIMSYVAVHIKEFDGGGDPDRKSGVVAGFFKDGYVCILGNVMRKIAEEAPFSVRAFCRDAVRAGTLKTNGDKYMAVVRNPKCRDGKGGQKTTRCYMVKMEGPEWEDWEDGDEGDAASGFCEIDEGTQMEIPF